MLKKSHLTPAVYFKHKKPITVVAIVGLVTSILYGYAQVYDRLPVTKKFTPPNYMEKAVGDFVWDNTGYSDVVFSQDYYFNNMDGNTYPIVYFSNKLIRYSHNFDHVYHKVRYIDQNFTVRILYYEWRRKEMEQLIAFLERQNIAVDDLREEKIGGLLGFDGKKFVTWYERVHECDAHPQQCVEEER